MTVQKINVNGKTVEVTRINNDRNGNPVYAIHFLDLGLKDHKATDRTRAAGLTKYNGKCYGGGFVFQSYNLQESLSFIFETLEKEERKPIANYCITADNSINIWDFEHGIEDYVITSHYVSGRGYGRKRKNKLYYDADSRLYFNKYGQRYYIDEFMRTDY